MDSELSGTKLHTASLPGLKPPQVRCPRCRYDVRSATQGWLESCPVEGRCAECGLLFRWSEIFNPSTRLPTWSVEFAPKGRWARAVLSTWSLSALRPRHVWRRLRMAQPIRAKRLAAYVAVLVVLPLFLLLPCQVLLAGRLWEELQRFLTQGPNVGLPALAVPGAAGDASWPGRLAVFGQPMYAGGVIEQWLDLSPEVVWDLEEGARRAEAWRANPPVVDASATGFGLRHVLLPFSLEPAASLVSSDGTTQPLQRPVDGVAEMLRSAREIDGSRRHDASIDIGGAMCSRLLCGERGDNRGWSTPPSWIVMLGVLLPPLTCIALWQIAFGAAVFVALPQTRRSAKVSWAHVGRVAALGTWVAVLPSVVPMVWTYYTEMFLFGFQPMATGEVSFGLFSIEPEVGQLLVRLLSLWAVPVLLWIWWSMAAKHYLKLPHAWGVALAQTVIAAMATLFLYQTTLLGLQRL